jgi:uncharacterized protein (DUF1330 family)
MTLLALPSPDEVNGPFSKESWPLFAVWFYAETGSSDMAAYLVVEHIITDTAKFEEYRVKVGPMIAEHGGRYLTKGGSHKMPEGGHWKPERVVVIEFPDMDALNAWYNSPEYRPLIALRKQCTSDMDMLFTLEGV